MKRALWAVPLLIAVSAWFARASYSYYYTENGANPTWSNWIVQNNGGSLITESYSQGGYGGITFDTLNESGRMTYPNTSASPGEVRLTFRMGIPSVGNVMAYLSASTDLSAPGASPAAGSGYRVYFQFTSTGSQYWLSKITNGAFTVVASGSAPAGHDLMTLRFVRNTNGLILGYMDNVLFVEYQDTSYLSGRMAVELQGSGGNLAAGTLLTSIDLGNLDSIAPNAVPSGSIATTAMSNHVDLEWPAASDDANGTGVYGYQIYRNGSLLGSTTGTSFTDNTVFPNNTYAYTLRVVDFHGNSTDTNFNITTPAIPAGTPEGRRVGVRTTGAYWGTGGENIDVLSGNLNFTLPLFKAQARSGWGVGFNLNYNSQNWRYDAGAGATWKYGGDVGYGFGWRLMAGSITPVLSDPYTVAFYLFTDSTGAEYRLDQNTSNVWSSKESIYMYFDAGTNILHFTDGSLWSLGCVSAAGEADAGTMYPTMMEDANGNQVLVRYQNAVGVGWTNSSARILQIEDVRASGPNPPTTYAFTYNTDSPPHLTSITNTISTGENYSFTYLTGQATYSPFNSQSYGITTMMRDVTVTGTGTYHEFTYNGSAELTQILLPYKGYLAYDYTTTAYSNNLSYREVVHRYLSKDGISSTQYPISHEASPGASIHQFTVLDDPGGVGEKYWAFATSGTYMGLVTQYQGRQLPGPVAKMQNDYSWAQDTVGNSYIASATTTADPGQSYAAAKKTTQTVDTHGNVTQVNTYNYGNLTTPMRTDNFTYLNSSSYTSRYIFNRLTSTPTTTISYDQSALGSPPSDYREWDSSVQSITARGNPTTVNSPAGTQTTIYTFAGGVATTTNVSGVTSSTSTTNATNYTAPSQVTVGSLQTSLTYSSFLGLTNETDPNGASVSLGYDAMARPSSTTSPFGAVTNFTYNDTGNPPTTTNTINGRWMRTTMDGLGRTVKTESGDGTGTLSVTDTEYGSCGCSPTGKMTRTSLPHAPGATQVWTTYTYDGIGRTLTASTVGSDTQSSTSYTYQGNTVTVTDATGKWKKFTMNALGQLVQVNEPNPGGGADYVTTYGYDTLGHLTSVNMPRPSGTQTRSFAYSGNYLTSATNPENGTVSYTYNSDKTLAIKTDAKSQQVRYTYDAYKRVTQVQRGTSGYSNSIVISTNGSPDPTYGQYPQVTLTIGGQLNSVPLGYYSYTTSADVSSGYVKVDFTYPVGGGAGLNYITVNGAGLTYAGSGGDGCSNGVTCDSYALYYPPPNNVAFTEDTCQHETYSYDTNPYDGSFSQNISGRLAAVQYKGGYNSGANPTCDTTFTEMYSYSQAGGLLKKRLQIARSLSVNLDVIYIYDNEGRITATQYPSSWNGSSWVAGPNLGNTFDTMGRLQKLTDLTAQTDIISNATYGPMGQLLSLTAGYNGGISETRTYNSLGQLTQLSSCIPTSDYYCTHGPSTQYNYSATQNDGKITSQQDLISGEQITYTYDSLNRLASATGSGWGQSYAYDGFGNLTNQTVTSGTAPALNVAYNPATNRQTGDCADANGNILSTGAGCTGNSIGYDVENRVRTAGAAVYSYAPGNKRVWRGLWSGGTQTVDEVTYWGGNGQKLVTYQLSVVNSQLVATATGTDQYFGGELIKNATGYVTPDHLGSIGKYFPYGQERPSATTDGKEKFATYFRDSETGLDYAVNRYHQPGMGRFMTPDPYSKSASANNPGSWNRYPYTGGDPVNRSDPSGNMYCNQYTCVPDNDCIYLSTGYGCDASQYVPDPSGQCLETSLEDCPAGDGGGTEGAGCYVNSLYGGGGCFGPDPTPEPPQPPPPPSPPSCDDVLTQGLQSFLQNNDPALLSWDPTLAADLVSAGKATGIDPRLMASITTLESGHGKVFGGTNNPFGLGPGKSYGSPQAAVGADASTLKRFVFTYGETSVSQLYSGNGNIADPRQPGHMSQRVAYCYGSDAKQKAACQAAGQTVSGFLSSQGGNAAVGLRPGDPNNLLYPCP